VCVATSGGATKKRMPAVMSYLVVKKVFCTLFSVCVCCVLFSVCRVCVGAIFATLRVTKPVRWHTMGLFDLLRKHILALLTIFFLFSHLFLAF